MVYDPAVYKTIIIINLEGIPTDPTAVAEQTTDLIDEEEAADENMGVNQDAEKEDLKDWYPASV